MKIDVKCYLGGPDYAVEIGLAINKSTNLSQYVFPIFDSRMNVEK